MTAQPEAPPQARRPTPGVGSSAVRALVGAVLGPVLAGYAAVVGLVSLLSVTADADWSPGSVLRAAAPLWLAAHQVPLTITVPGGAPAPLGVLPLLPTLGVAVLVARSAAGVAARLDWHTPPQLATLAVAFAGSTAALGAAVALAEPLAGMTATPLVAAAGCAATTGPAALWGGLRAAGFSRVALTVLPAWAVRGVLAGLAGLVALLTVGTLFTLGGLLLSAGTVGELLAGWGGAPGGRFGVTVLSVAYLPNAIVGATSWTMGPGLSVGAVSVTPFGTSPGTLPPIPLLAALPEPGPAPWRVLVFALPLLAGLLVARRCRGLAGADRAERLHAVVAAGVVTAAGCSVLALTAGGRLGGGAYDPVRIPSASLAIAAFVWIVLPAGIVVVLADRSGRRAAPGPDDFPDSGVPGDHDDFDDPEDPGYPDEPEGPDHLDDLADPEDPTDPEEPEDAVGAVDPEDAVGLGDPGLDRPRAPAEGDAVVGGRGRASGLFGRLRRRRPDRD